MPLRNYKLLVLQRQGFGRAQFFCLQANRFTKHNLPFDLKDRFPVAFPYMNVNRRVIVTIEEKAEAVFGENCRYRREENLEIEFSRINALEGTEPDA
jgi:hypothetical protein